MEITWRLGCKSARRLHCTFRSCVVSGHLNSFDKVLDHNSYNNNAMVKVTCLHFLKRKICTKSPVRLVEVEKNSVKTIPNDPELKTALRKAMRNVPQPVVVVSTAEYDKNKDLWIKRGVTCASFTSVSMEPPIVSFCINNPSRFHGILLQSKQFAVNVLAKEQVRYGVHFSKPSVDNENQFENVPHEEGLQGVPLISDCSAVLQCQAHSVHTVGDHNVWYGQVVQAHIEKHFREPLLYCTSSYRSVGDEIFIQAFEDATLPFEDWTHEAHLRMAWNYIRQYGKNGATPLIKKGILKYNEQNKDKIKTGYHETVTIFYIHLVEEAIRKSGDISTFEDFISANPHLVERSLILNYYSPERIALEDSKLRFMEPDKQALP